MAGLIYLLPFNIDLKEVNSGFNSYGSFWLDSCKNGLQRFTSVRITINDTKI